MADAKKEGQDQAQETIEAGDFEALLKKEFRPKSDQAKEAVETAVKTLAEQALAQTNLIGDDIREIGRIRATLMPSSRSSSIAVEQTRATVP